ncbi:MAG TPA: M20/M25/M40 family metallo-hydrolase [Phycisphaerales bacterium]|nr:M20/M25/M40 family metallo-hydrolase [Phycisphaerales bacterium]HMP38308.1 M20/M25/M40 family metallo-hydrolase [Phycisphaerales bacterium]
MTTTSPIDATAAVDRLMRYIAIEGQSGKERLIAEAIAAELKAIGVPASAIRHDDAARKIDLPTEVGNLLVSLPGTKPGPRLLFSTHLDVVPICAGAKPKRDGDRIVPEGETGLGGDNRTGCAVLVTLVETILKRSLPHPPITLLFTVREESGLQGAKHLDPRDLEGAAMCFNVDGKLAADLITGAVGAERWEATIKGKAAHAGVAPENGISSTLVASIALADAFAGGWWGKVQKPEGRGTSNAGIFEGRSGKPAGDATNVVTDFVHVVGETRSPDEAFAATITAAYGASFEKARGKVKDAAGGMAELEFKGGAQYPSFNLPDDSPVVAHAKRAAEAIGLSATCHFSNGGLDANWLVRHGVPTVTIGAGQYEIHTVKEYVDVPEYLRGCHYAVALATA